MILGWHKRSIKSFGSPSHLETFSHCIAEGSEHFLETDFFFILVFNIQEKLLKPGRRSLRSGENVAFLRKGRVWKQPRRKNQTQTKQPSTFLFKERYCNFLKKKIAEVLEADFKKTPTTFKALLLSFESFSLCLSYKHPHKGLGMVLLWASGLQSKLFCKENQSHRFILFLTFSRGFVLAQPNTHFLTRSVMIYQVLYFLKWVYKA